MISSLFVILMVLILFGLTIFFHELGHFMVARWCGLKIEAFSIGFGPALLKKTVNGVMYKIGLFPFGGYVALPQLDPTLGAREEDVAEEDRLPAVTPLRKIAVSVAGVIMNMIFAFFIAWFISVKGMPAAPEDVSAVVGFVDEESSMYKVGMRIGDEIISVDGEPVSNWKEFMMLTALKDDAVVHVQGPDGENKNILVKSESSEMGNFRLVAGLSGRNFCKVLHPIPGSSADRGGVLAGDLIVSLDGITIHSQQHMITLVGDRQGQTIPITVDRDGEQVALEVTPEYDEEADRPLIGIAFNNFYKDSQMKVHPSPVDQISDHAWMIFRVLKAFLTPGEAKNAAGSVGGPLAILYMFWLTIKASMMTALWLTALINVNLAIVNMLPLPILDGGHVCFALYEMIRGKPMPPRVVHALSNVFFILLIAVALTLTYRDFFNFILPVERSSREAAVEQMDAPELAPASAAETE